MQDIVTEAKYFIATEIYSGYWQVVEEEKAHEILELFTLDGKQKWKAMPTWDLHAAPTFVAMIMKLQMECGTLDRELSLNILNQKLLLMMCYCMGAQPISS